MAASGTFDLDALLKLTYEYNPLKRVLEHLLNQGKETAELVAKQKGELDATRAELKLYSCDFHA